MNSRWPLRISVVLIVLAMGALLVPRSWIEAGASEDAAEATGASEVTALPDDLHFTDLAGEPVDLEAALENGPVLLDFWATWCAPCKIAMPAYDAIWREYADQGLQLWAVSWDRGAAVDRIEPWFASKGFEFPARLDPEQASGRALGVRSLPTTFLVRTDGTIAWQHTGFAAGDEREAEAVIREVLGLEAGR